jgi:hypothetical protein
MTSGTTIGSLGPLTAFEPFVHIAFSPGDNTSAKLQGPREVTALDPLVESRTGKRCARLYLWPTDQALIAALACASRLGV